MKTIIATIFAMTASATYAGPALNCPGNSCNAPPFQNGPAPISGDTYTGPVLNGSSITINRTVQTTINNRINRGVINRQNNAAPVASAISGVSIRATAGRNSAARISGNTISSTAVGNSSVIRVIRGR